MGVRRHAAILAAGLVHAGPTENERRARGGAEQPAQCCSKSRKPLAWRAVRGRPARRRSHVAQRSSQVAAAAVAVRLLVKCMAACQQVWI